MDVCRDDGGNDPAIDFGGVIVTVPSFAFAWMVLFFPS